MVRLSQIYTKTGDDGTTGLGDGTRLSKAALRVEAYGTVDEANAAIGMCVVEAVRRAEGAERGALVTLLRRIQNELFDVGADLCCPRSPKEAAGARLRIEPSQTLALEHAIDEHNARLAPLKSFVLPGGSPTSAALHVARTVVRRAERLTVALLDAERDATNPEVVKYLNRLSDLLFVLARVENRTGHDDILWAPGASRGGPSA